MNDLELGSMTVCVIFLQRRSRWVSSFTLPIHRAGLVILAISGAEVMNMESQGPETITTLGDDFVGYLGDTDQVQYCYFIYLP